MNQPTGTSQYKLTDLVDISTLGEILDNLYVAAHIPSAIIDMEGNFLTGAGWQRICLNFHRKNPETAKLCKQSDTLIWDEIGAGKPYVIYDCPLGLVDSCCPVIIEGRHLANVFTGQMLHTPPDDEMIDHFRMQARQYGFDEKAYLEALSEVPVFSPEKHKAILDLLSQLAGQIAQMGLNNLRILEQKKKLEESEELYRSLFQTNRSTMLIVNPATGDIVDANPAACVFYGYSREEITGKKIFDINMLTKDQIQRDLQRAREEEHQHFYFRHRLADGEIRDVEVYAGPITRHGEELLYSIIHDITDRKRAENAIRKSEEQWDRTFNSFADIVTLQDVDFRLVKVNQAVCDYLAVSRREIVGRYCYELFHGVEEPCHDCPLLKTKETFEPYSREMYHEKLGKTFLVSAAPVFNEQGKLEYVAHVAKDITQQKQLEDELFQAHKLEAIGTLAGGIAHDFNNILSAIIGYAEFIQMEVPPESQSGKDVRVLIEATRRATDLVKQILTFSHKSGTKKRPLRPYLIVREALKMIRATMPTSIVIEKHIDPDCGTILVNPTQLHQIIVNLCTNARQAMADEKGILRVDLKSIELHEPVLPRGQETAEEGRFVVLRVSDTGCGMDTEMLSHIFEPYFTTKDKGKGTGLGLSVVHGIVQECRGFLEVESHAGRGSTFTVYLPAIDQQPETEPVQVVDQGQADLVEGVRVLVVDDEPQLVRIQEERLRRRGYQVTALTDSREALSIFREQPDRFDLLLTDQTMPVLTGADLAQAVLELNPSLPIILCTGYSDTIPEEKALALGIKKYFTKPVSEAELFDAIRRLLKK